VLKSMLEEGRAAGLKGFEQVCSRLPTLCGLFGCFAMLLCEVPANGWWQQCAWARSCFWLVGMHPSLPCTPQVAAVHLHPEPFSVENGMMTPTFKLKRPQAQTFFQHAIDGALIDLDMYCPLLLWLLLGHGAAPLLSFAAAAVANLCLLLPLLLPGCHLLGCCCNLDSTVRFAVVGSTQLQYMALSQAKAQPRPHTWRLPPCLPSHCRHVRQAAAALISPLCGGPAATDDTTAVGHSSLQRLFAWRRFVLCSFDPQDIECGFTLSLLFSTGAASPFPSINPCSACNFAAPVLYLFACGTLSLKPVLAHNVTLAVLQARGLWNDFATLQCLSCIEWHSGLLRRTAVERRVPVRRMDGLNLQVPEPSHVHLLLGDEAAKANTQWQTQALFGSSRWHASASSSWATAQPRCSPASPANSATQWCCTTASSADCPCSHHADGAVLWLGGLVPDVHNCLAGGERGAGFHIHPQQLRLRNSKGRQCGRE